MTDDVRQFMRLAVDEASQSPTGGARVGAVLVRDGAAIAAGHKGEGGTSRHAEAVTLDKAKAGGIDVRGATAFVTLEPCANIEGKRTCCADLLADAGITTVYIGRYDRMFRVNRQGWKTLIERGVTCRDFHADFRDELDRLNATFDGYFLQRDGLRGRARFDHKQNGGRYLLATDDSPAALVWTTEWHTRGSNSIYAYGGRRGTVALARYAREFEQIDDPDAYDFEHTSAELDLGSIAIYRNQNGHALVRLLAVEAEAPYGDTAHTSLKIDYELRPKPDQSPVSATEPTSSLAS
jgi:diaminohydroxyphosphoribosylaminopyrimidine deaminase/5-amino-6-(5-phosphoribosylamino)uracil reductase